MTWEKLKNPPIREAILEIRYVTSNQASLEQLNSVAEALVEEYPTKKRTFYIQNKLNMEDDKMVTQSTQDGYHLSSKNGLDIIILKTDRVLVARLKPYQSFDRLKERTTKVYKTLSSLIDIEKIKTIDLRFINEIKIIPSQEDTLNDYITIFPHVPNTISNGGIEAFSMEFMPIKIKSLNQQIKIQFSPDAISNQHNIRLDIHIWKQITGIKNSIDNVLPQLDQLREVKNNIFYNSIGKKLLNLLR